MAPQSSTLHSTKIALSKGNVISRMFLAAFLFLGGVALWYLQQAALIGIVCGIFSAGALAYGVRFLLDEDPGLILDAAGISINEKLGYGGMVPWTEVKGLNLIRYGRDYQLIVHVMRPNVFIANGNYIYRNLNALSFKLFGSPVRINTGLLDYNREDLLKLVEEYRLSVSSMSNMVASHDSG